MDVKGLNISSIKLKESGITIFTPFSREAKMLSQCQLDTRDVNLLYRNMNFLAAIKYRGPTLFGEHFTVYLFYR